MSNRLIGVHVDPINWNSGDGLLPLLYSICVNAGLVWVYIYLDPMKLKAFIEEIAKFDTLFGFILNSCLTPVLLIRFLCNALFFIQNGSTIVQLLDSIPFRLVYLHKTKYYSYLVLIPLFVLVSYSYFYVFASLLTKWPTFRDVICCISVLMIELRQFLVCMISHYCLFAIWQLLKRLERQLDRFPTGKFAGSCVVVDQS